MSKIDNCKWKQFKVSDLFDIARGNAKNITQREMIGETGLVSAMDSNNAFNNFITPNNTEKTYKNVLTVHNNGNGVGLSFYHEYNFIATSDVTILISKEHTLTMLEAEFISTMIRAQREKFNYGYKMANDRMGSQIIMLPVDSADNIDWKFMNDYMGSIKENLIKSWCSYSEKFIKNIKPLDINLSELKWASFKVEDFFEFKKGNQNKMNSLKSDGNVPLISAKKINNGLKQFTEKNGKYVFPGKTITLNIDGDGGAGLAYYQPCDYLLDSHVSSLTALKPMTKYTQLFITKAIEMQKEKYGHGYALNDKRMKNFIFMLPIDSNGQPYLDFMDCYMRSVEKKQIEKFEEFLKKQSDVHKNSN